MSQADAISAVGRLVAAYRQEKVRDETIEVYAEHLQDIAGDVLELAVRQVINECKFMPTVAEIRTAAKDIQAGLPAQKPMWALGDGSDRFEQQIPKCGFCGADGAFGEKDGKPICLKCQVSPITSAWPDGAPARTQKSPLPRGDAYEPEPADDQPPAPEA